VSDLSQYAGIRLDIGCGGNKSLGFVGMDCKSLPGVDIVHDWNVFPWPLEDESVLVAMASHVVEHISPINGHFLRWMDEVWRVMKPWGEFVIITPHGRSDGYLQDPTHCNPCNETTWAYFDPDQFDGGLYWFYAPYPWRVKSLTWSPETNVEVVLIKRPIDDLERALEAKNAIPG
jgi:hypothetical protein